MRGPTSSMARSLALSAAVWGFSTLAWGASWQVLMVGLRDDPRHDRTRIEQAYPGHPIGRPLAAAQVAADESRAVLDAPGHQLKLQSLEWDGQSIAALVTELSKRGPHYLLLDLPLAQQKAVMAAHASLQSRPIVFNIAEGSDELRGASCHPQWLHTLPSERMRADALAQWLAARGLPYNTAQPRPVVGHGGLAALAWHPRWERYGAPQLSRRFQRHAGRPMVGHDWAAWVAVKSIAAVLEDQPRASLTQQLQALRSGAVAVDGFKGGTVRFRPWDGQMRQPVFLARGDGVAAVAPLDGAMHPRDVLDTLGADDGDSACKRR